MIAYPSQHVTTEDGISQALRVIKSTYGVEASIIAKRKDLNKFGRTTNAASGVKTTVATFLGSEVNETFVTTNAIDALASDDSNDDGKIVTVEGHYYDADNNLIFHVQDATLGDQAKVTLSQALCRMTRIKVKNGTFASPATELVGNVYGYASSGVTLTGGVPQTASSVKIMISAGNQQTTKCATAVSSTDYWIIKGAYMALNRAAASTVTADIDIEYREQGGVWLPFGLEANLRSTGISAQKFHFDPYRIAPANSDIRMVATTNTNDTTVYGRIVGVLATTDF